MLRNNRLLRFILEVAGLIITLSALIPFLSEPYCRLVAGVADFIAPADLAVTAEKTFFSIFARAQRSPMTLHSMPFIGGFFLLLALLLVTPGIPLRKRPVYLAVGLVASLLLQVVTLVVVGWLGTSSIGSWLGLSIATLFLSIGIELFPVLIWLAISYRFWVPFFLGAKQDNASSPPQG